MPKRTDKYVKQAETINI